jgi:hypothetical protein
VDERRKDKSRTPSGSGIVFTVQPQGTDGAMVEILVALTITVGRGIIDEE